LWRLFQALAVADTLVLYFGLLPDWLGAAFDFHIKLQALPLCRSFYRSTRAPSMFEIVYDSFDRTNINLSLKKTL
jgi:hypothetical protein